MSVSIVIPTIGRQSLTDLLAALAVCEGPRPDQVIVVDDRADPATPLQLGHGWPAARCITVRTGGRGPAAARNAGWRHAHSDWIAFLDDDVLVGPTWLDDLAADLAAAEAAGAGGSQARLVVPLPGGRRATDWERTTAGLAGARWITADLAYRRSALAEVAGFDERFPRAFREDADLALRLTARGHRIVDGSRLTCHPVRPADWLVSVRTQRGNADDALMRRLHGPGWHRRAGAAVGRRPRHLLATGALLTAVAAAAGRRPRLAWLAGAAWAALTAEFAATRIAAGPRTPREVATMTATSVAIPPLASWHWLRGLRRHRHAEAWPPPIRAVLVDRDGTLVRDVPYNGEPALVEPLPGVEKSLIRLRQAGLPVAVVSNQSGIGRGLMSRQAVAAVDARVAELLGPFDGWLICPHAPDEHCRCRKPEPGLVLAAAAGLGVPSYQCAVIGDIGSDLAAATAAGATLAVLVPTPVTRPAEVAAAELTCEDFEQAAELVLRRAAAGEPA